MANEVSLTGKAELEEIYKALRRVNEMSASAMTQIGNVGKNTQSVLEKTTKKTETQVKQTGGLLRRMASQLYSDFKALAAIQGVIGGLKLANQFSGSVRESVKLGDTIRRLGNSFGITRGEFGKFHSAMAKGLGDIGASSESAANALEGLAGFGVKGIESALALSKGAVTLAGIGGEKGNEKIVAAGLAGAIQQQGKSVNDVKAQKDIIGEVTAAVTTTGKSASEILNTMNELFSRMPEDLRKKIGAKGIAQLATVSTIGGPGVTKAFQEYLSKDPIGRMAMEAQGFKPFNKAGQLDLPSIGRFIESMRSRVPGAARTGLQTAGFSEEAAEGLVRLGERASDVASALSNLEKATRDNEQAFKDTMGLMDAFRGSINTVKGHIEAVFGGLQEKVTDLLTKAIGSKEAIGVVGAAGVVGSKVVGTATGYLAKQVFGQGIGGAIGHEIAGATIGEGVNKVFVTNAAEIGEAAASGGGKGGLLQAATANPYAAVGIAAGYAATMIKFKDPNDPKGEKLSAVEHLTDSLMELFMPIERARPRNVAAFTQRDNQSAVDQLRKQQINIKLEHRIPGLHAVTGPSTGRAH